MTEIFVIQSDIAEMAYVEERLFHFCHELHIADHFSLISVATVCAVENAIVHGNGGNLQLKVSLKFGTCRGGVFVEVEDSGQGFDFQSYGELPNEGAEGEGIFVMHTLADHVHFTDGGRRVRMEFAVGGIALERTLERIAVLQQAHSLVTV